MNGAQAEALRIPYADGTLYRLEVGEADALMPSLLTLSDVMGTGHHAAVAARVAPGNRVAVVGDGAVGLCGVIAAKRLGAEQIIILGRHAERITLAQEFGATDVVRERGEAAVERVKELTGGYGAHSVLECVGHGAAMATSIEITRPGGAVGRVGVPQEETIPDSQSAFFGNISVGGGPAPIAELPDNESATAVSLAFNASGALRAQTHVLVTPEEVDAAAKRSVGYRPPTTDEPLHLP